MGESISKISNVSLLSVSLSQGEAEPPAKLQSESASGKDSFLRLVVNNERPAFLQKVGALPSAARRHAFHAVVESILNDPNNPYSGIEDGVKGDMVDAIATQLADSPVYHS